MVKTKHILTKKNSHHCGLYKFVCVFSEVFLEDLDAILMNVLKKLLKNVEKINHKITLKTFITSTNQTFFHDQDFSCVICQALAVLHAAARLITGVRRNHITASATLRDTLHWLLVPQRIVFKISVRLRSWSGS